MVLNRNVEETHVASAAPRDEADTAMAARDARARTFPGPKRFAAFAAATLVLAMSIAFLVSMTQETIYGGRAEVLFERDSDAFFEGARDMETQKELMRSGVVLGPVSQSFGISREALDEALEIEVEGESDVLRVTVAHPNSQTARMLAARIVESYVRSLEVSASTDRARVVTPAYVLEDPVEPRPVRAAAAGAVAALLVVAGVAILLTHIPLRR
jgi:capsular polysaccharide biosynthesis protein